jgi:hypothetical protein
MAPDADPLAGNRLSDAAVDELLADVGWGVLALPGGDVPYPVPLSFGFDGGDRLFFLFAAHAEEGRKLTRASAADRAAFLATEVTDDGWRSALVEGAVRRAQGKDEWDAARAAFADNAWRPDLFGDVDERGDPRVWTLVVEERGGRVVGGDGEDG